MRIKRVIAKVRIAQRKRQQEKIKRDTYRLQLQRNKALKDAELKAKKAQALEEKRQAELKKLKVDERLKVQRDVKRKARKKTAEKIGKGIVSGLKEIDRMLSGKKSKRRK